MKNLTTKPNTTSGATTYIQKEFNALTIEGNEVIITVTRKISTYLEVSNPFKTQELRETSSHILRATQQPSLR